VIYAGVRGYLDKVLTSEIGKFEQDFLEHMKSSHLDILTTIRKEGELSKETDEKMAAILKEYMPGAGLKLKS
jgi:F-type H+-transporting ATPase subunit alpha